ncbi:hypothetical protein HK097_006503, partial [Rhizophlyctis rosea]
TIYSAARKQGEYLKFKQLADQTGKKLSRIIGLSSHADGASMTLERWFDVIMCRRCWGMDVCGESHCVDGVEGCEKACLPEALQVEVVQLAEWWKRFEYSLARVEEVRLKVGPLILEILNRFGSGRPRVREGDEGAGEKRICYYSAHDTTISALLAVVGGEEERWPAYGSNLVFELWELEGSGERVVRVLFNGRVMRGWCGDGVGVEGVDVETGACALSVLEDWVDRFAPRDLEKECRIV